MIDSVWRTKNAKPDRKNKNWLEHILAENRGLDTPKKLHDFLNPTIDQILAVNLTDTKKAIERVKVAIASKEKIIVYCDYDADGIMAGAIMWETLYDLGANIMPYVPHRIKEGYGFFIPTIEQMAADGVKLIITVDHGVTATKAVEAANNLGIDVVITDHHVLPKETPKAYAMVHSTDLCGAGVAWKFCWQLIAEIKPDYKDKLLEKLELAAIATVADLVPLNGACRAIVKLGLLQIAKTTRPGLKSLIRNAGINVPIGTYEIGHVIAPRINAMGRIEHAMDSLRLICAKSYKQADKLASLLSKTNTKRQGLTTDAIDKAFGLYEKDQLVGVLSHPEWHEGVIGLVASRLVETHFRPMIAISKGEIYSKGSARSIPGFNIVEAIRQSSELLIDAGGHPMAAGFTIETRHIEAFSKKINVYAQTTIKEEILIPTVDIECQLQTEDINKENFKIIKMFEPYGQANPQPIFLTKGMNVEDVTAVGQNSRHLKLYLDGLSAIAFGKGELRSKIRPGYKLDVAYTIDEDNYNGHDKLQLKIRDLKIYN